MMMMKTTSRGRCTSQKPLLFHHFSQFVMLFVSIVLTAVTINVAVVTLAFQSHNIRTTHSTAVERNINNHHHVPSTPFHQRSRLFALVTDEEATTKKEPPKQQQQSLSDRIATSSMASAAAVATAAGRCQNIHILCAGLKYIYMNNLRFG
jgi:hypothetical protein